MPPHAASETIESHRCRVVVRRVEGPDARRIFLLSEPSPESGDADGQAEAVYRAILDVLAREGAGFEAIVRERVFFRDLRTDLDGVRAARDRVIAADGRGAHRPATTEIEQPPLNERARLAVSVEVTLPADSPLRAESVAASPGCGCSECAAAHGLRVQIGNESQLHVGALYGSGAGAYEQALAMFGAAETLLRRTGMEFRDVVRTWIHLREMDRDYADLNRARREFFETRGLDPLPASTGIGGGLVPGTHDLCLGLTAVRAEYLVARTEMTAPTLNDAARYGADFARGIAVAQGSGVELHVSGTASIDEAGQTAHPNDFEAQVDRMLVNVAALLDGQGASFADVVSAVTYVKRASDGPRLREKLRAAGFDGFPNAQVAAPICRPELLCETEVLAVLPGPR